MTTNDKGGFTRPDEISYKGTIKNLKSKILQYLFTQEAKATEINRVFHTGDARKYISMLRKDGHPIADYRASNRDNTKVYFIHSI